MSHHAKDPLSGHPGHLTPEQEHKLAQFKQEITAEGLFDPAKFDDAYLLRFLRARKFDLPKTKIMWTDHINWRREFKVDELYDHFDYKEVKEVDKIYPQFYHRTDKDGRPVYIEVLGKIDVAKLYQVTTPERQLQRLVVEYEKFLRDRLPVCSEGAGRLVETSCSIMDLKGVGVSQFWKVKDFVQSAAQVSSNNYPETMGKFYVINAPWAFTTVWSFVKSWLDEVTVSKIQILGGDYLKTLEKQIPIENLPKFLGGKCSCAEGCTLSNAGPWQDAALVKRAKEKWQPHASKAEPAATQSTSAPAPAPAAAAPTAPAQAAPRTSTSSRRSVEIPPTAAAPAQTSSAVPHHQPPSTAGIVMHTVESKIDA